MNALFYRVVGDTSIKERCNRHAVTEFIRTFLRQRDTSLKRVGRASGNDSEHAVDRQLDWIAPASDEVGADVEAEVSKTIPFR